MIASGMDTRAFRLPIPANVTVFELDGESVVGRLFGRWPPRGVSEDVVARAERINTAYFVTAERAA